MQKSNISLYVTDMSPNGTNDLIIVDNNNEIIDIIPEATFGLTKSKPDAALTDGMLDDAASLKDAELIEAGITQALYTVSIQKVMQNIAVNPVNNGLNTVNRIKAIVGE